MQRASAGTVFQKRKKDLSQGYPRSILAQILSWRTLTDTCPIMRMKYCHSEYISHGQIYLLAIILCLDLLAPLLPFGLKMTKQQQQQLCMKSTNKNHVQFVMAAAAVHFDMRQKKQQRYTETN